jgi:hypothetical protein
LPAVVGALAGSGVLLAISDIPPLVTYQLFDNVLHVTVAKLTIGVLLLLFASAELSSSLRKVSFPPRFLPIGGLLSGFFGGLAGMQGALRSAFLVKAGLSKQTYVATGAGIAFLIDVSRLGVYSTLLVKHRADLDYALLGAAVLCAFLGATVGNALLPKITMGAIQGTVAVMLFIVGSGLVTGVL